MISPLRPVRAALPLFLLGFAAALAAASFPPLPLSDRITVSGQVIDLKAPPAGLVLQSELGLLTAPAVNGHVVHRTATRVLETRATITPGGDYLLLFPEGEHYATAKGRPKVNTMIAYRSPDRGRTWQGPTTAFDIDYSQHGFIPFIPRGTKRLYAFGTQPVPGQFTDAGGQRENAPIGFRWSDDEGRTWSPVTLIVPTNDPGFRGMSVMRMTETAAGTWLLGSHTADWSVKPFTTRQYLLRSADQGRTWELLPGPRPNGWFAAGFDRMDEGRPLGLDGRDVFFMARTPEGHLWSAHSHDDGRTWTLPSPTPLIHPDAPPMLFTLADGKTLVAFHHHRTGMIDNTSGPRSEIWCATSADQGRTWSEPRFVFANALLPNLRSVSFNHQASYLDAFSDDGTLNIFFPHRWQQVVHLRLKESDLATLPTLAELRTPTGASTAVSPAVRPPAAKAAVPVPVYVGQLAARLEPTHRIVYKEIDGRQLHLDIFAPADLKPGERRACFVGIHGGGWTSGNTRVMYTYADHAARRGLVGISVQYRLLNSAPNISVFECVKDGRSMMRYLKSHAAELGIDPNRIAVAGASAGGHIAAGTAIFDGIDEAGEETAGSSAPAALILLSPVIDTSADGYGHAKAGPRWQELSPVHHVRPGLPPTLLFHGTTDATTPFKGAQLFHDAMVSAGNRCDFVVQPEGQHTFMFKDQALYERSLQQIDAFLASLGL